MGEGRGWGGGGAPYKVYSPPSIPLHQQQLRGTSTGPIGAPFVSSCLSRLWAPQFHCMELQPGWTDHAMEQLDTLDM